MAMKKAGKIRDERVTAEELIRRYDRGGKVGLERREFLRNTIRSSPRQPDIHIYIYTIYIYIYTPQ